MDVCTCGFNFVGEPLVVIEIFVFKNKSEEIAFPFIFFLSNSSMIIT